MANTFNIILGLLFLVNVVFISYTALTVITLKGKYLTTLPQPFKSFHAILSEVPIINIFMNRYKNDLYLIHGSKINGEMVLTAYAMGVPSAMVIIIMVCVYFIDIWYYCLPITIVSLLVPYLSVTNRIMQASDDIKADAVKCYQSVERFFNDKVQTAEAFTQLEYSTSGPMKRVIAQFNKTYMTDRAKAYEEFEETLNDKYASEFIREIQSYDDDGFDCAEDIRNTAIMAEREFMLNSAFKGTMKKYRMNLAFMGLIAVGMATLSSSVESSLGGGSSSTIWLSYISILIVMVAYVLSLFYERM